MFSASSSFLCAATSPCIVEMCSRLSPHGYRLSVLFFRSADAVDNGSLLLGSASLVDQATLKIDRDLLPNDRGDNFDDRSELLSYSQVSVTDSNSATPRFGSRRMNADLDVSATNSQNSLSQVSQLSPELDSVGDLESSELLADV